MSLDSAVLDIWVPVRDVFKSFGFTVLERPHPFDNGPDMVIVGDRRAHNVEIKRVRLKSNGILEAEAISENQTNNDFIALVFPNGYVFVENMETYLKSVSTTGYRYFTKLNPKGSGKSYSGSGYGNG